MFANDAAPLGNARPYYDGRYGNRGTAEVMIRDIDALPDAETDPILKCGMEAR